MEPNQNPPSEREWTIAEREEFFASQDAITGLLREPLSSTPSCLAISGIHVTSIVPPAQGWPIAMHCPLCKETTFVLSRGSVKPEKGDYWLMKDTCGSDILGEMHNMEIACDRMNMELLKYPISPKSIFGYDPTMVK